MAKSNNGFAADIRWEQEGESHTYSPKDATLVSLSVGSFSVIIQGERIIITQRDCTQNNPYGINTLLTLIRT